MQDSNVFFIGVGCAGEIRLAEHEDYEKWAIEIFVKFREEESLMQLTPHRQSGGVSIIAYFQRFSCRECG